jgi:tungstate transport system ATP-binding protein
MISAASVLELEGVRVERGGATALDIASFHLHEGEFLSVIGPNGSGKTTFLLSLMSLLPRAAGRVLYRGRPVDSERAAIACRRRMAMVLQEPLLFDATVRDNVAAGLRIRGVHRKEIARRVARYLDKFKLADLAERSARKLSGGEARRVSLARALVVEPEVVLLDEPFTGLDLPTRRSITEDMERILREARAAAILVTHDQAEALRFSDRLAVMNAGVIVQSDAPRVVMNDPVNEFVASCVGMETILEGVVRRREGGGMALEVGGKEIHAVVDGAAGDAVYCCIRPENVLIEVTNPARTSSARNVFPAMITSVTSIGPYLKVKLDCGFPLVAHVTTESYTALDLAPGKPVFASFKATAIHVIRRGR